MGEREVSINDFKFKKSGYGHYWVEYTSPETGKKWLKTTNDMPLIDATMNEDEPKLIHLKALKAFCKKNQKGT